jgi:uncharacterized protein (TIGR01244 family)
MLTPMLAHP